MASPVVRSCSGRGGSGRWWGSKGRYSGAHVLSGSNEMNCASFIAVFFPTPRACSRARIGDPVFATERINVRVSSKFRAVAPDTPGISSSEERSAHESEIFLPHARADSGSDVLLEETADRGVENKREVRTVV